MAGLGGWLACLLGEYDDNGTFMGCARWIVCLPTGTVTSRNRFGSTAALFLFWRFIFFPPCMHHLPAARPEENASLKRM
jgi:hypothetical protein